MACMDWDDYLRHEAAIYRQLAEKTENVGKQELLDLAAVCEEVANSIEDRLTGDSLRDPFGKERGLTKVAAIAPANIALANKIARASALSGDIMLRQSAAPA